MRSPLRTITAATVLILALSRGSGLAQVSVNPRALDQLSPPADTTAPTKPNPPAPRRPAPKPVAKPSPPSKPPVAVPATPPPPPPPVVPAAPPPPPVIPPPIAVPIRPDAPPPPPVIANDAPSEIGPIKDGWRVIFGAGRADLSPAVADRLRGIARSAAADASFTLIGYAKGVPEDPSTPRRLSLSRVLTLRSLLMGEGIPSIRIYAKALGAGGLDFGDGPADRADIVIGHVDTNPAQTVPAIPAISVPSTSAPPPVTRPAP